MNDDQAPSQRDVDPDELDWEENSLAEFLEKHPTVRDVVEEEYGEVTEETVSKYGAQFLEAVNRLTGNSGQSENPGRDLNSDIGGTNDSGEMTNTVTPDDNELEGNIRCPKCAAVLSDDEYDFTFGEYNDKKFDCSECGEVTIEQSMFGKAARVEEGELTKEEAFGTSFDARDPEEVQAQYDQMNEPLEVDISEEITGPKGTCDRPDCDRTDGLRVTKYGTHLCPEHHKEGDE